MCLWNTDDLEQIPPQKDIFRIKGNSQGHSVIYLGILWKGFTRLVKSLSYMPNIEVFISYYFKKLWPM